VICGDGVASIAVPLPDTSVGTVKDIFNPFRTRQPAPDLDSFPAVRISVGGGLAVDLDQPPAATRNHVYVLAHLLPFQGR
jgi:hypothetical protein